MRRFPWRCRIGRFRESQRARIEHEDGTTSATLHLHHADPDLCVPLMTSDTVENVASDWHSWARRTGLPMLMVGAEGTVTVVREAGLQSRAPKPRRARITQLARRPRFLRRRKPAIVGPVVRLDAQRNHRPQLDQQIADQPGKYDPAKVTVGFEDGQAPVPIVNIKLRRSCHTIWTAATARPA